jgi:aerobic-type carbon monoxide dehydrogenase small subunit (CoxS/CutS family)
MRWGHEIVTAEGIGKDPKFAPLIEAFCEHDAAQCGYCIPGILVRSAALLKEIPSPTAEQVREGLAGNLCRCGTYSKIFDAVEACGRKGGLA